MSKALDFTHKDETTTNKDYAEFFFSEALAWKYALRFNGEFEVVPYSKLVNNRRYDVFIIQCNHLPPYMTKATDRIPSRALPLFICADDPSDDDEDLDPEDLDDDWEAKCQRADFDVKAAKELEAA